MECWCFYSAPCFPIFPRRLKLLLWLFEARNWCFPPVPPTKEGGCWFSGPLAVPWMLLSISRALPFSIFPSLILFLKAPLPLLILFYFTSFWALVKYHPLLSWPNSLFETKKSKKEEAHIKKKEKIIFFFSSKGGWERVKFSRRKKAIFFLSQPSKEEKNLNIFIEVEMEKKKIVW